MFHCPGWLPYLELSVFGVPVDQLILTRKGFHIKMADACGWSFFHQFLIPEGIHPILSHFQIRNKPKLLSERSQPSSAPAQWLTQSLPWWQQRRQSTSSSPLVQWFSMSSIPQWEILPMSSVNAYENGLMIPIPKKYACILLLLLLLLLWIVHMFTL